MFVASQILALFTAWSLEKEKCHKTPLYFWTCSLQNGIINFLHLILMANLSSITLIKLLFLFNTSSGFFVPVWSMHNLLLWWVICFWFWFGCVDCSFYAPKVYLSEVLKLTCTCCCLWTNYCNRINICFILLTMLVFW